MMEWREDLEAIRTMGLASFIYHRFFYRHHMRWLHNRGRHKLRHFGPMLPGGGEFDRCDWCGHMENVVPPNTPFMGLISGRESAVDVFGPDDQRAAAVFMPRNRR